MIVIIIVFFQYASDADASKSAKPFTLAALHATLPQLTSDLLELPAPREDPPTFDIGRFSISRTVLESAREALSDLRYALVQQHVLVQGSGGELVNEGHQETFHRLLNSIFNAILHDSFVVDTAFGSYLLQVKQELAVAAANEESALPTTATNAVSTLPVHLKLIVAIPCSLKRVEIVEALLDSDSGISCVDGPLSVFFRYVLHHAQIVFPVASA